MTVGRTLDDSLRWMRDGTERFLGAVSMLDVDVWDRPTLLDGWTRLHLVAHVAANADAVGNLVRWAATGVESPMYRSAMDRADGIAQGDRLTPTALVSWTRRASSRLASAMEELTAEEWRHEVVTAQGRTVPASETPWMRSREVMVHAVDLDVGVTFADLPRDFLSALRGDIETKRGSVPDLRGDLPEVVAHLAGRPSTGVTSSGGGPAPLLGPWL